MKRLALVMTLTLPLFLLRGRAIADGIISGVALLFVLHCLLTGDRGWRQGWCVPAFLFWGVAILSSIMHGTTHAVAEAFALGRFIVFCAALASWILPDPGVRRALGLSVTLVALWLIVECWQQYLFGANLWGYPRWGDGALTGPFARPRAGPPLVIVAFPGVAIYAVRWFQAPSWPLRAAGACLIVFLMVTMILIGQRMPTLLFGLGLVVTALLSRPLRWPILGAGVVGCTALALLPVLSPPAYEKLVVHFLEQMRHFPASPYGQLYIRAGVMLKLHPWLGLGVDGFRRSCADPAYVLDLSIFGKKFPTGDASGGCNIHPHNVYLDVAVSTGLVGLACMMTMIASWLRRLDSETPEQMMLLVALCMMLWPLASSSALFTVRTAGWLFLMAGWGLAATRPVAIARTC